MSTNDSLSEAAAAVPTHKREALLDAAAALAGAASAYRTYARRHNSQGRAEVDAFFSTRVTDMDKAVERARAALAAPAQTPPQPDWQERALKAEAALRQLVCLKDMKDRLHRLHEMGHGTDWDYYHSHKLLAWDEARAVLAAAQQVEGGTR